MRRAIREYRDSPFYYLLHSGCRQSMITVTGFDYRSFYSLLQVFSPFFFNASPYSLDEERRLNRTGRPRKIDAVTCLGLVLVWTRSQGGLVFLQPIFGLTYSCLALWLRFGIRVLQNALRRHPLARVSSPTVDEVREYQRIVTVVYPRLGEVWGTCDGLNLRFERSILQRIQRMFYNGWLHGHFVSNVFVFAVDGTIRICGLNAPGSMHDSTIADYTGVYDKLERVFELTGGKVIVDSAFKLRNNPYLIRTTQTLARTRDGILFQCDAVKLRQSAEWGMRSFQASFPRLRDRIRYEERGERLETMRMFVYLYNFRTNLVGCNQIRSTFAPWLEAQADNLHTMFNLND
jgi:hypothetical protein